jgi:hypothetical protein
VQVGTGEEDVDAVDRRGFDRAGRGFNVVAPAARERGDARSANFFGDGPDRFEIARRRDGEARLEDVDAERRELVRHAQLLTMMHGASGALLAVAERGVKEDDVIRVGHGICVHKPVPFDFPNHNETLCE